MKITNKPFTIIRNVVKENFRYTEKERDIIVGNKKILTRIKETTYNETPSYYNDGMGGTNVKTTIIDDVFDYMGRLCGSRKEESHVLTVVNENGRIYTPQKPLLMSKRVTKECRTNDHTTITTYGYGNGYRTSKIDKKGDTTTISYYSYTNGMPSKK